MTLKLNYKFIRIGSFLFTNLYKKYSLIPNKAAEFPGESIATRGSTRDQCHNFFYLVSEHEAQLRIRYVSGSRKITKTLLTREESSSVVYRKNLSMSGPIRPGPTHADAFERLISPRLWIRFPCDLHRGIDPFKLP